MSAFVPQPAVAGHRRRISCARPSEPDLGIFRVEIRFVDSLDFVPFACADADPVFPHEARQPSAVNQDDALGTTGDGFSRGGRELGSRHEHCPCRYSRRRSLRQTRARHPLRHGCPRHISWPAHKPRPSQARPRGRQHRSRRHSDRQRRSPGAARPRNSSGSVRLYRGAEAFRGRGERVWRMRCR